MPTQLICHIGEMMTTASVNEPHVHLMQWLIFVFLLSCQSHTARDSFDARGTSMRALRKCPDDQVVLSNTGRLISSNVLACAKLRHNTPFLTHMEHGKSALRRQYRLQVGTGIMCSEVSMTKKTMLSVATTLQWHRSTRCTTLQEVCL